MYWQYFNYHYPHYYVPRTPSLFEPPNVQKFKKSAQGFITPAHELQVFLNAIANQHGFAKRLMDAAQASQKDVVKKLIQSLGIYTPFTVKYNPDGIIVIFQPSNADACFNVSTSLCW